MTTTDLAALIGMRPFLVLAPHPDDETLGCGGLLAMGERLGLAPAVAILTDGSKSHSAPGWPAARLAGLRRDESLQALRALGLPAERLHFLSEIDGQLEDTEALGAAIARLARKHNARTLFVTDPADSHPDHMAAFRLAVRLVKARAADALVTCPIGQQFEKGDLGRFRRLPIPLDLAAKKRAIAAHQSQTTNLLPPQSGFRLTAAMLKPFRQTHELFRPVFGLPGCLPPDEPGHFDALFDTSDDPWGYTHSPYEQGRHAATIAALGGRRFERAWEAGAASGILTEKLLGSCDKLVATDASPIAAGHAQKRIGSRAEVACMRLPEAAPDGSFDLILLSDMLYYLGLEGVIATAGLCEARLRPKGMLVVVSYLGATDAALTGLEAAEAFRACKWPGLHLLESSAHPGFRLDRYAFAP